MSRIESNGKNTKRSPQNQNEKATNVKEETTDVFISINSVASTNKKVDPKSKWIIVELAEEITFEAYSDVIEQNIKSLFGQDTEYFVPLYKEKINDKVASLILFEGYFFIRSNQKVMSSPEDFHSEYIKGPLKKNRAVVEISGIDINELKRILKEKLKELTPKKKQIVIPKVGVFSNLEGEVISIDKKNLIAIVQFQYSTRIVEAPISFINLTFK